GLGKVVGLGAGFLAWVSYNLLQIGLWGLFGVMAEGMMSQVFGIQLPWYVLAVAGAVLVFGLAAAGVDVGARVLGILLGRGRALPLVRSSPCPPPPSRPSAAETWVSRPSHPRTSSPRACSRSWDSASRHSWDSSP